MASTDLLSSLGIGSEATSLLTQIDDFQAQNLSPGDIYALSASIPQTVGGAGQQDVSSQVPSLSRVPPPPPPLDSSLNSVSSAKYGVNGEWESVHYADDLNKHHPKFKFLFKVLFKGFAGGEFYYYVHRCDKPKVRFNHQDINYYNFRTRVLTSVIYEPLMISFLDEVGNSITEFFAAYLKERSGTGQGNYGIDRGWGGATSSKPYKNGYSQQSGQQIVIEQIFMNRDSGILSNRFTFMNPRIETFDFDELAMDESNNGSMATVTFTYDAITVETVSNSTINSWGDTDLLRGGGTSGRENAGETSGVGPQDVISTTEADYSDQQEGADLLNSVPSALTGIYTPLPVGVGTNPLPNVPSSSIPSYRGASGVSYRSVGGASYKTGGDTLSLGIQRTLGAITSGANLISGGLSAGMNMATLQGALTSINGLSGLQPALVAITSLTHLPKGAISVRGIAAGAVATYLPSIINKRTAAATPGPIPNTIEAPPVVYPPTFVDQPPLLNNPLIFSQTNG